ncbi:unnamed protein product [Trifolium pratense]|uniref:Uncharacterized protein n=1 Tax=Trifolium pratense TaxID=57577 RepID=A0ACB0KIP7_TRIPR|nr:unnamed protein product [Trifolium pratense]
MLLLHFKPHFTFFFPLQLFDIGYRAFFWTVPALFNHFLPYFYVIFLTILLFDRAKRDDDRCRTKYGKYWKLYCDRVPYRIIPGIYILKCDH